MSVAARLLGFAALLAGVFAFAVYLGDQADLGKSEASDNASGEHAGSGAPAPSTVRPRPTPCAASV